ncbi:unnamed protein product [Boreogadus saida]
MGRPPPLSQGPSRPSSKTSGLQSGSWLSVALLTGDLRPLALCGPPPRETSGLQSGSWLSVALLPGRPLAFSQGPGSLWPSSQETSGPQSGSLWPSSQGDLWPSVRVLALCGPPPRETSGPQSGSLWPSSQGDLWPSVRVLALCGPPPRETSGLQSGSWLSVALLPGRPLAFSQGPGSLWPSSQETSALP